VISNRRYADDCRPGQARDPGDARDLLYHQPCDVFVTFWLYFSHPLALHLYFLYPHTVGSANFEFGGTI
jgi:hypothetical protein